MINTVLFDLDGTLIRSTEIIMEGYENTIKKFFPELTITEEEKTNFLGRTLENNLKIYTKDKKIIEEMTKEYRKYTNEKMKTELITYPNAINVVKYLKDEGIKIGIVTSKVYEVALNDMKTVGLDKYFDVIIAHDHVENHKPHPESLLKALEELNSKPEESIYIGDHENDIIAGNKAGMLTCAVTYSHRLKEMLLENPTYVIDDLKHIEDIV